MCNKIQYTKQPGRHLGVTNEFRKDWNLGTKGGFGKGLAGRINDILTTRKKDNKKANIR